MVSLINEEIGNNIRHIRKLRGMTMSETVDAMAAAGLKMSVQALSMLERGVNTISAEHIHYLSIALHCPEQLFYHKNVKNIDADTHFREVISHMSPHQREGITYLFFEWQDGDAAAVLENALAYAAILDPQKRCESCGVNIQMYEEALKAGRVADRVRPDLAYLKKAHLALEKKTSCPE